MIKFWKGIQKKIEKDYHNEEDSKLFFKRLINKIIKNKIIEGSAIDGCKFYNEYNECIGNYKDDEIFIYGKYLKDVTYDDLHINIREIKKQYGMN